MNSSSAIPSPAGRAMSDQAAATPVRRSSYARARKDEPVMGAIVVAIVWVFCLAVGVAGFLLPYARAKAKAEEPTALIAQKIEVELAEETVVPDEVQPPDPNAPPPPPDAIVQPQLPTPVAVAQPSPAIAFAVPVEGPVRIVEAKKAVHVVPPPAKTNAVAAAYGPAVPTERLELGVGAGMQQKPVYPYRAKREGQEGTVVVWMSVGTDGRVIEARAIQPCAWELLNDEAVRTVRYWNFGRGPMRAFEVPFRFYLTKK